MKASSLDQAIKDYGLTAVRQMSAAGMPILPHPPVPVRRCVDSAADVSAPGEGPASRLSSGAVSIPTRSANLGAADGQHGTPSPEAAGAKMGEAAQPSPDRAGHAPGHRYSNSGQAVTNFQSAATLADTAPAAPNPPVPAGAVSLSDATLFILGLVAAHEGRPAEDIVAELVAGAGEAIGLSPLLTHAASEIGDLSGLPNHARRAANRFRSGVP